ncbi:MAG: hypothetical protein AAGG51_20435 [Cyanobacteria bacterium P01_G01_bin.54]
MDDLDPKARIAIFVVFAVLFTLSITGNDELSSGFSSGLLYCHGQGSVCRLIGKTIGTNLFNSIQIGIFCIFMILILAWWIVFERDEKLGGVARPAYDFCEELLENIKVEEENPFKSISIRTLSENSNRLMILNQDSKLGHFRLLVPVSFALLGDGDNPDLCGCRVLLLELFQGMPDARETAFTYSKIILEKAFKTGESQGRAGLYIGAEDYILKVLPEGMDAELVRRRVKRFYRDIRKNKKEIDFIEQEEKVLNDLLGQGFEAVPHFDLYKDAKDLTQRIINELYGSIGILFEYIQDYIFDIYSDRELGDMVENASSKSSAYYQARVRYKDIRNRIEEYVSMKKKFPNLSQK